MSYRDILLLIISTLICSAFLLWFFELAIYNSEKKPIYFSDAVYFSVVSFTSLGYGDILPVGLGKVIVCVEVFAGLAMEALLIGKIASERQSALLLLMYTSDNQRKLLEFENNILDLVILIDIAMDDHDQESLFNYSKDGYNFLASISKYLVFHADQGALASSGNIPSLRKVYKAILRLEAKAYEALQTSRVPANSIIYFNKIIKKAEATVRMMKRYHIKDERVNVVLAEINTFAKLADKWNLLDEDKKVFKYRKVVTKSLKDRVLKVLADKPLLQSKPKSIAYELNIGVHLTEAILLELSNEGYFDEPSF